MLERGIIRIKIRIQAGIKLHLGRPIERYAGQCNESHKNDQRVFNRPTSQLFELAIQPTLQAAVILFAQDVSPFVLKVLGEFHQQMIVLRQRRQRVAR